MKKAKAIRNPTIDKRPVYLLYSITEIVESNSGNDKENTLYSVSAESRESVRPGTRGKGRRFGAGMLIKWALWPNRVEPRETLVPEWIEFLFYFERKIRRVPA